MGVAERNQKKVIKMMFSNFGGRMMGWEWGGGYNMMYGFGSLHFLLGFATWVLVIALLAGLVRWVWKKGDKVK